MRYYLHRLLFRHESRSTVAAAARSGLCWPSAAPLLARSDTRYVHRAELPRRCKLSHTEQNHHDTSSGKAKRRRPKPCFENCIEIPTIRTILWLSQSSSRSPSKSIMIRSSGLLTTTSSRGLHGESVRFWSCSFCE